MLERRTQTQLHDKIGEWTVASSTTFRALLYIPEKISVWIARYRRFIRLFEPCFAAPSKPPAPSPTLALEATTNLKAILIARQPKDMTSSDREKSPSLSNSETVSKKIDSLLDMWNEFLQGGNQSSSDNLFVLMMKRRQEDIDGEDIDEEEREQLDREEREVKKEERRQKEQRVRQEREEKRETVREEKRERDREEKRKQIKESKGGLHL